MRTRIDDMAELTTQATEAIASALRDGDRDHGAGSWAEESTDNQYDHLLAHLYALQNGQQRSAEGDDELDHLICRAVIIRALRTRSARTAKDAPG